MSDITLNVHASPSSYFMPQASGKEKKKRNREKTFPSEVIAVSLSTSIHDSHEEKVVKLQREVGYGVQSFIKDLCVTQTYPTPFNKIMSQSG